MNRWTQSILCAVAVAAPLLIVSTPAEAGIGDLLVAPTRIVLDGRKGAEIILNNIGEEPATYRVSIEWRRMTEDGGLVDVTAPTAEDQKAADMVVYAPRKVVLAPHQPQAIRVRAVPPAGIPDGEYRVHLLFRAIPPSNPVVQAAAVQEEKGLRFQLTPVYGVTIPVIVRLGNLQASAQISNVRLERQGDKALVDMDISRSGQRSTFGEVRVFKAGVKNPIALQKAVAVYTEIGTRHVTVPLDDAYKNAAPGEVTVQYVETFDDGSNVLAETKAVLR
jgi:P pilus assembly chaperone PapD